MAVGQAMRGADALVGRVFGEFVVREPLSSGGFAMVFRAEQPALGREAVIKVLHARLLGSETVVQRFLREARLASLIDHPYAAHTYAFGAEPDGVLWIAMELVRGTPLDRMLEMHGPIPLERFVPLIERICEVVHTAHEQGIVHRDLKPGNVMVLSRAGRLLPKLLDLGIAKVDPRTTPSQPTTPIPAATTTGKSTGTGWGVTDEASLAATMAPADATTGGDVTIPAAEARSSASSGARTTGTSTTDKMMRLTRDGSTMGSPLYMAPEQWNDAGAVDARTDVYSLGVLCYEAITGRPPFAAGTELQLAYQHAHAAPAPMGGDVPPALEAVLFRALAKNPADRQATALELAAEVRAASGIAAEAATLPRLDDTVRTRAMASAPRPIAIAVEALDAARNAHQARDALFQVVRVAVRLTGVIALAAHSHVAHTESRATNPGIGEALRLLRARALSDAGWLELAQLLTAPFARLREAHPVPELVEFLHGEGRRIAAELAALRGEGGEGGAGSEVEVRALLERALPRIGELLAALAFLDDYPLAVTREGGPGGRAEDWMGTRREPRPRALLMSSPLPPGRPILVDAAGAPVVTLWPFAQVSEPAPGAGDALFLLEGRGRRGARLVALPATFEREDEEMWEAVGGLLGDSAERDKDAAAEESCPFPGLAPFRAADAPRFFGRERASEAFLNRLRVTPLLAVVGPSGAGKSSFVQAGVLPALPEGWISAVVRPGPAPLVSLAARLTALGVDTGDLRRELSDHPGALGSALRSHATREAATIVLVVDQLEELFTLCDDEAERLLYAEALARAARSADDPVRVVFTLRDDFLLRAEGLAPLRSRLGPALQLLTTPAEADLRRILVEPLRRAGYQFDDPALPDEMVEAVTGRPGALALLSFTASKLWELRDRRFRTIGHKAYRSLGGVGGALARHAEDTLAEMHPEEQRLVREVFRHLVTSEGTRAVLTRGELDEVLGGGSHAVAAVEKLVTARLLVVSDSDSGGERVEVTHEALLDAWPRLVTWRREDSEGARLRDQLRAAARQWEERGRPSGLLWRGDALAEYRLWRTRYPGALTAVEEAFAGASQSDDARGRTRRRRALAALIAGLAVVAIALFIQNTRVGRQRAAAEVASARAARGERDAKASADRLSELLLRQYEGRGRELLLGDDPLQALVYLTRAGELGARGFAHDFLVTQAVRESEGFRFEVRHEGALQSVSFSPDGERLATGSDDGDARLWDAATGALLARLTHRGPVRSIDFSPDGTRVTTASTDGDAAVWDTATGARVHTLAATPAGVEQARFTVDGARVVTTGRDDSVVVWNATTGARERMLRPGRDLAMPTVAPMALDGGGALLAVGDARGGVVVWDLRTFRKRMEVAAHSDMTTDLELSPDGRLLLVGSRDGSATLWDVASGRLRHRLSHQGPVSGVVFSPDGKRVVTTSTDRTAIVWDTGTGQPIHTLRGHQGGVTAAAFVPDGRWIVTVADDAAAILWDAATGTRAARWQGARGSLTAVDIDDTGRRIATSSVDGTAVLWSADPQTRVVRLVGHQGGAVFRISFSTDGSHLVTAGQDGTARLWDAATGRELQVLRGHEGWLLSARLSPNGERVATCGMDRTVRVWDARSGAALAVLRGHTELVRDVAWHPDGRTLVSVGNDGTARIWDVDAVGVAPRVVRADLGLLLGVGFTPDGESFALSGESGAYGLWRTVDQVELVRHQQPIITIDFDRAGKRLLGATVTEPVLVLSTETGARQLELAGHIGGTSAAAFGGRDQMIVTGGPDGTVRLWDSVTGDLLLNRSIGGQVWSADLSPDGARLAVVGETPVPEVWTLPRPLTAGELERVIRCQAPYALVQDRVVHRTSHPDECTRLRR